MQILVLMSTNYSAYNNQLLPGALSIGNLTTNYGGAAGWSTNTAGLLMECLNNTEIVILDSGEYLISALYYVGGSSKYIEYGRAMGGYGHPNGHYFRCNQLFECYHANAVGGWNYFKVEPTSLWGDGLSTASDQAGTKYLTMRNLMFQNPHVVPASVGSNASIRLGRAGGVQSGAWWEIATRTDGGFHIVREANETLGIRFNTSGWVGINYPYAPDYPLHVYTSTQSAYVANGLIYTTAAGTLSTQSSTQYISIKAYDSIWTMGYFMYNSDERIKKDIRDINDDIALQKILAFQPKLYKYIDINKQGDKDVIGFIAQQVEEIEPLAVFKQTNFIPNIYKSVECNENKIFLDEHDLKVTDKLEIYDYDGVKSIYKITEINGNEITLDRTLKNDRCVVYGKEVDDFKTLDKTYIFTLNVCATQELSRKIDNLNNTTQQQQAIIDNLNNTIQQQQTIINDLINRITLLENK